LFLVCFYFFVSVLLETGKGEPKNFELLCGTFGKRIEKKTEKKKTGKAENRKEKKYRKGNNNLLK
jgi:hypothetical protein